MAVGMWVPIEKCCQIAAGAPPSSDPEGAYSCRSAHTTTNPIVGLVPLRKSGGAEPQAVRLWSTPQYRAPTPTPPSLPLNL